MSDYIEPTDAQVAAFKEAWVSADAEHHFDQPGDRTRIGLRAALNIPGAALPPLPTEPYTVIRASTARQQLEFVLRTDGWLRLTGSPPMLFSAETLRKGITGFEVVSEPVRAGSGS